MGATPENIDRANAIQTLEKYRAEKVPPSTILIDGEKEMASQITDGITAAIKQQYGSYTEEAFVNGGKAQDVLTQIMFEKEKYEDLADDFDDVNQALFDQSTLHLTFYDGKDVIADFNLEPVLKPFLEKNFEEKYRQRRQSQLIYGYDQRRALAPAAGALGINAIPPRKTAGSNVPEAPKIEKDTADTTSDAGKKTPGQSDSKAPEGSNLSGNKTEKAPAYEEKPSDDMLKTYAIIRQKRENVLASTAGERPDIVLNTRAELDPAMIRDATDENPNTFDESWRNFNNFAEMQQLLAVDYAKETGYRVNPFKVAEFSTDALKELIKDAAIKDNALSFEEISQRVFSDRYDQFKAVLKQSGVTDECFDLVETDVGSDVDEIDDPLDEDNLLQSYKKMLKISNRLENVRDQGEIKDKEMRALYPYKDQIKNITEVLGDYCAAITTLINYLQNAKLNAGEILDDEKNMMTDRSDIAKALQSIFLENNDKHALRRYDDELHEVLGIGENPPKAKFRDLNGNVAFVDGNWFNEKQSAETAYKLAYEAAQPGLNAKGEIPELDEKLAVDYINRVLNLGIATIPVIKSTESIGKIINELSKAKVTVPPDNKVIEFQNDSARNQQNLYAALEVHDIAELNEDRTSDANVAKFKARHLLMRIGAVVDQKEQDQHMKEVMVEKKQVSLKLKPEEVKGLVESLKATKKFSEEELQQIEQRMLVGIMLVGNTNPEHWYNVINGIGVSAGFPIDLGHDVTMTIGGAITANNGYGLSAGVGKKFTVEKGTTITLSTGVGANLDGDKTVVGPQGQVIVTKELENCDLYVEAGANAGFDVHDSGKLYPGFSVAVGFNRTRAAIADNYKAALETAYNDSAITKLDRLEKGRFEEVSKNPNKYPGLGDLALRLTQSVPPIAKEVQERVFEQAYAGFKEQIKTKSMQEAVDGVTFAGLKVGVSTTILTFPFPPFAQAAIVPSIGVEVNLWNRKLTYISSTPERKVERLAASEIQRQITENLSKQGKEVIQIDGPVVNLKSSGSIVYLPGAGGEGKGEYVLSDVTAIDFSKFATKNPDVLGQIKQEMAEHAGLSVKEAKPGQLTVTPYKAHGQIDVYPDPSLPKDVFVTWKNGDLILSAPKNANLKIARFDETLPLQDNGVVERTVIVVTDKNNFDFSAIQQLATHRLTKFPGRGWVKSRVNEALGKNTTGSSAIVDYTTFTQDIEPTLKDRVQSGPVDDSEYQDRRTIADKALLNELTRGQAEVQKYAIDPRVTKFVEGVKNEYRKELKNPGAYKKDINHTKALQDLVDFKRFITDQHDIGRLFKPIESHDDRQALEKSINEWLEDAGLGRIPNPQEFAFIIREFTDETFLQFDEKTRNKDKAAFYKKKFEGYDMPMFLTALENDPDPSLRFTKEESDLVKAMLMAKLSKIDFNATPEQIKNGTFLMQDVGNKTLRVKGEARYVYQNVSSRKEGVWGRFDIRTSDEGVNKKLAQYLIKKNSPYKERTAEGVQVDEKTDAPIEKKLEMAREFRSIFSQRVMTVLPAMLTDVEMHQITKFVKDPDTFALNQKDHDAHHNTDVMRFDTIKKVLGYFDKIRAAELSGEKSVSLSDTFIMHVLPVTYIGAYSVCTNYIKALEDEIFVLVGKETRTVHVPHWTGSQAELSILTDVQHKWRNFSVVLGLAVPIPRAEETDDEVTDTVVTEDDGDDKGGGNGGNEGGGEGGGGFRIKIPHLTFKVPNLDEQPKPGAGVETGVGGNSAQGTESNAQATGGSAGAGQVEAPDL